MVLKFEHEALKTRSCIDLHFKLHTLICAEVMEFYQFDKIDIA